MAKQEIVFKISKSGEIHAAVKGMKGRGCEQIIERLEELGDVKSKQKTSEYFETASVSTRTSTRTK